MNTFRILDWRPLRKNSLVGFARVELPSGMVIADVALLTGPNGPWASPPSKPMIGRDGVQMRTKDAKPLYVPVVSFETTALARKFSDTVIAALRLSHPDALPTQTPEIVNV